MSFKDYKKNRATAAENLSKKIDDLTSNSFNKEDDRFWQPSADKLGNGSAIIHFLPAKDGEDVPFIRIFSHGFQGPGGWYINTCLTTDRINSKGKDCPACEANSVLWNTGIKENQLIVSGTPAQGNNPAVAGRKRKLTYISNILVIKDKENPDNEGKVFLYKYGAKIFEKVQAARSSQFDDAVVFNPFDMIEGANFRIIIKKVKGYRSYEDSKFDAVSPVAKTDERMEEIYNALYSLNEFISDDKFISYNDLTARLNKVLGQHAAKKTSGDEDSQGTNQSEDEPSPSKTKKSSGSKRSTKKEKEEESAPFELDESDSNDTLARFKDLASDD